MVTSFIMTKFILIITDCDPKTINYIDYSVTASIQIYFFT